MEVPQVVKRNFVYVGDCIEKIGEMIEKYPVETIGVGSPLLAGLVIEGLAHLTPKSYSELYIYSLTPGQPTAMLVGVGVGAALTYRGLRWLHKTYKNWKYQQVWGAVVELNQSPVL